MWDILIEIVLTFFVESKFELFREPRGYLDPVLMRQIFINIFQKCFKHLSLSQNQTYSNCTMNTNLITLPTQYKHIYIMCLFWENVTISGSEIEF